MANADITKYGSIKLDYLFCIIVVKESEANDQEKRMCKLCKENQKKKDNKK
jgi:hypothetical protein